MYVHVCIGEDGSYMGNGCESHLFSNVQELLSQNSLALYNYKVTAENDCSHEIKRHLAPWKKRYDQRRQHIKKQRHYFANNGPSSQGYGFSCGHVWMCVGL